MSKILEQSLNDSAELISKKDQISTQKNATLNQAFLKLWQRQQNSKESFEELNKFFVLNDKIDRQDSEIFDETLGKSSNIIKFGSASAIKEETHIDELVFDKMCSMIKTVQKKL